MDLVEKIRRKAVQTKKASPLDFLSQSHEQKSSEQSVHVDDTPADMLKITHLGTGHFQHLSEPAGTEFIELKTEDPSKLRYLRLIVALLESSNYDEAISSIAELKELG